MKKSEDESLLQQADSVAGSLLANAGHILPGVARTCLMASTLEDSMRYWREYKLYNNYFANLWMTDNLEPDYWTANFLMWPLILKFIPALFVISNLLDKTSQKRLCYFFYIMGIWNMVALQGYPGGRNWNLWQIQHITKFWCAISLIYAEACEESKSMFAGLPSLGEKFTRQAYMSLFGRGLFGFLFVTKLHFMFSHWRFILDWVINLPSVILIVIGYKTKLVSLFYLSTLMFDNFYFHQFWRYFDNAHAYEHVAYSFFANLTIMGVCLQWILYGPGGISLDKSMKKE